jgi:hypothetical protein
MMTSKSAFKFSLLTLTFCLFGIAASSGQTAREIMEQQKKRHQVDREETTVQMELINRSGNKKERTLNIYSYRQEDGLSKGLIKFTEPADIRGVGLLTWEQAADQEDDQWIYIPAAKRVKRIAAGGKKNAFMGTDFAFEDMRPERLDAHEYKLTKSESVDGHDCYVIEAVPSTDKEKKESGYGKRIFWIRKDILITVKTEFYDNRDRLVKSGTSSEIEALEGNVYRAGRAEMETIRSNTKTVMITKSRSLSPDFDESFFTQQVLSRRE